MYSFNFSEDEENRKKKDSQYLGNEDFSGDLGADYIKPPFRENPKSPTSYYDKDDVFNKTTFASSFLDNGKNSQAPDGAYDGEKPGWMVNSLKSTGLDYESGKPRKSSLVPTTAREMTGAAYKNDRFMNRQFNYVVPETSPERNGFLYAASPKALEDVASGYFKDELSAEYEKNLDAARIDSNKAYTDYPNNPVAAMRISRERQDPVKIVEETMKGVDTSKLRKMVEPLARRAGFDTDSYVEDYVKPALRDMMLDDYIDKNTPKSSAEYVMRKSFDDSLIGKATNIGLGSSAYNILQNESLARYNPGRLEKFAAGVGSLLIDSPVFAGIGSMSLNLVGKATSVATNKLAARVFSYNAAEGMSKMYATRIAERLIKRDLSTKIAQSAATQGLTLGTYDLAHSIADDVLYNESIDAGKALGAFAKSFATGGVSGALGTRLKKATRGLTGGRKMLASTGVLSAESAVFTLSAEMDKLVHDVDIEPIDLVHDFTESVATLGIMKMAHWRPKGVANKLNPDGTLKDELKLSKSEQEELREINIDPVDFMKSVEKELNLPSYGVGARADVIRERYIEMMQSKDVSAATKSKLMYIIENKLTSTPPVAFDYDVERTRNGEWAFNTYDFEGNRIERRIFEHSGNVKNHLLVEKSKLRNNRIAAYERELLQGLDSRNLLRQAGLYAQEKSVSIDDISQALYKRACNVPLSGWEDMLVRDIVERVSYDQNGMVQYLSDMRRNIEKKHGLMDGSLLTKINKPFYSCTKSETLALDEYEAMVRDEVNALKAGADSKRAAEFRKLGEESRFKGMGNDEVKSKEVVDFYIAHPELNESSGTGNIVSAPIKVGESEPDGYVWSVYNIGNTAESIKQYEEYARKLADKYNVKMDFITDERQIPYPDKNNGNEVLDYNNRVHAMGWMDRHGRITINLPNIKSNEDVEKTVVHESVAHHGLLKLFGNHLNPFLEEVLRKSSSEVRAGIDKMKGTYKNADSYTLIEEYLASLTEKSVLSPGERAVLSDIKDFMKNALVRMNIYTGRNRRVTEKDLTSLLRQHAKYVEKRTPPSKYRRWVFGLFDAAKQDENTYYDREAYGRDVQKKIAGGKYFVNTPKELYDMKLFQNYKYLPDAKKEYVLKKSRLTDEQMMAMNRYAFPDGKDTGNGLLKNATLKEVFDDPSFYAAYPELADLPVEMVENQQQPVRYDSRNKRLFVDRSLFADPGNSEHISHVLQEVVQDYEGFNKAVSMNLLGINSRLGRKYNEAQTVIRALDNARLSVPDFDRNGEIDKAFEKEYGFTPDEFRKRFPTLDEYTIYGLTGSRMPFSDNAVPSALSGEKTNSGSVIKDLGDLMKYFNGPLDIVYQKLQQIYPDDPRLPGKEYGPLPKNDYGYGEFKKKQDERLKRLKDAVEFQKWRDAFRHLGDEIDEQN